MRRWALMALFFVAAMALFSINNRFRLGLHIDEVRKMRTIFYGQFQYNHPLLMLETTRLAVLLLGVTEPQAAVEVGRALSALIGAIGVAALFLLLRRRVGEVTAVVISLAAMTSPLLAVHAHYLKEDIWLFGFCALAILAFRRLTDEPKPSSIVLLGLCLGLAVASKAVGAFLIPVVVLAALLEPAATRGRLLISVALASVAAVAVAALVNLRMLFADSAWTSLFWEIHRGFAGQGLDGHDIVGFPLWYHLTHSLWPGLGPVLLGLGVIGLALSLLHWRRAEPTDRLMTVYAVTYYGLIEASPLKGGTDMARYALPLVLPMAYFAGLAIEEGAAWLAERRAPWPADKTRAAARTAFAIALMPTALTGLRLVSGLQNDTRILAEGLLAGRESQVVSEMYGTSFGLHVRSLAMLDPRRPDPNIRYLVASSFVYDRLAEGASIGGAANAEAKGMWGRYQAMFRLPYCEIRPSFMSYGFSNPTIRIIDLRSTRTAGETNSTYDTSLGPACASGPAEK
jgi:4-amino-4-deoxy-L-arabinose transferase-like glycosyltransferase